MRHRIVRLTLFAVLTALISVVLPVSASATSITCPNPTFTYPPADRTSNTYTVDPAIDCVWGPPTSNNIGGENDDFLTGEGINDPAYGNSGPTFGMDWEFIAGTGTASPQNLDNIVGLTFTNVTSTSADWSLDLAALNAHYNTSYTSIALGIKDGEVPFWAVFLLDNSDLSGSLSMTGGSFSHFVAYGSDDTLPPPDTPPGAEPGTLLMLGAGLAALARKRFRKN